MNEYSVHCTFFSGKRHLLNQFSTMKFKNGIMKVSILRFNYQDIELLGGRIHGVIRIFQKSIYRSH